MAFTPRDIQAAVYAESILNDLPEADITGNSFSNELQFTLLTCKLRGYIHPLTLLTILDSKVHGGFDLVKFRVNTSPSDEQRWVLDYLLTRHRWLLATKKTGINRVTALLLLVKERNWDLTTPFEVDGFEVEEDNLELPVVSISENQSEVDILAVRTAVE